MNEDPTLPIGAVSSAHAVPPPRAAAWGGFTLIARVGAGGFGEVYRAWDPSLQREIALKLLLPGAVGNGDAAAGEAEYESTLREARALASVRHPNIVSIYGVDRHDGRVGFWTDFVKGKTLSALVGDHGPYGFREAALIGLDVTRALSAVHRAGLLHCDIKPENVMREEGGRILLMDFGLSSLPQRGSHIAGTPNYMAPELLLGAPPSVATDIHAVGVLLYFLVSGAHPVKLSGLTLAEAAEASKHRTPLVDYRSDLPDVFLRVVNRAIALDPANRYTSAGQMAEALAECIGIAAPAPVPYQAPPPPPPSLTPTPTPTPTPYPYPYPLLSAKELKKLKQKEAKPGRRTRVLGAILVAVALIMRSCSDKDDAKHASDHKSDTTAETATAIAAAKSIAKSAGSDNFDDLTTAQELLLKSYKQSNVNAAAGKFKEILDDDPKSALAEAGLGSAYFLEYRNSPDPTLLEMSQTETNKAIKLDPDCAPAYVTLARIYATQGNNSLAMATAKKAMSIDSTNADAYRAIADVYYAEGHQAEAIENMQKAADLADKDWRFPMNLGSYYQAAGRLTEAKEQFQRSAELAPDNPMAYSNLGHLEIQLDQLDDARKDIEHSLEIEPQANTYDELGWLAVEQGRYADAIAADQKAVKLDPADFNSWSELGGAYWLVPEDRKQAEDAYSKAISLAEETRKKEPKNAELAAALADFYARLHETDRSRSMLRQALLLAPENPRANCHAGEASELLGNRAQAIHLIAKCIAGGYSYASIQRDPDLAQLLKDPAFQTALHAADAGKPKNPLDSSSEKK
jgi:serine/threonine protein kinase/Flp pilus assembly protein TadD